MLRVLQERQVERVGSHQTIELDVRIIAATNQDLARRVAAGQFREDLYYRINVFPLKIAPLRERPADVMALAERFLLKYRASMGLPEVKLSEQSRRALLEHAWPGNVRELENAIQRGLLLCNGLVIQPADMDLEVGAVIDQSADKAAQPAGALPQSQDAQDHTKVTAPRTSHETTQSGDDMRHVEREHILGVLRKVGGSRKKAVQILGISERTLRYKLKSWKASGVEVP